MRDDIDHTANDAVGQVVINATTLTINPMLVILQVDNHCQHNGSADEECLHGDFVCCVDMIDTL